MYPIVEYRSREPWNKGKLVGQKAPLKLKEIWSIRIRLQLNNKKSGSGLSARVC